VGQAKVPGPKTGFLGRMLRHYTGDTWRDPAIRERLSWYYNVLRDLRPSKFLICKDIACEYDLGLMTETESQHAATGVSQQVEGV